MEVFCKLSVLQISRAQIKYDAKRLKKMLKNISPLFVSMTFSSTVFYLQITSKFNHIYEQLLWRTHPKVPRSKTAMRKSVHYILHWLLSTFNIYSCKECYYSLRRRVEVYLIANSCTISPSYMRFFQP